MNSQDYLVKWESQQGIKIYQAQYKILHICLVDLGKHILNVYLYAFE